MPVLSRNKNVPSKLAEVIDKSVSKYPKDRYYSEKEMKNAIERAIK